MLRVLRISVPNRAGFVPYLHCHGKFQGPFHRPDRARHDGRRSRSVSGSSSLPAPAVLAGQQALFPAEFSDYIQHNGPSHLAQASELEGKDSHGTEELPPHTRLGTEHQDTSIDDLLSVFLPSHARRNKIDLSHTNSLWWQVKSQHLQEASTTTFRVTTGLRQILVAYLRNFEAFDNLDGPNIWHALRSTFPDESLQLLECIGYDVMDVANWAWIFSSGNIDLALARYVTLAEHMRRTGHGRIPKFVPLQLLRAECISRFALKGFIQSILADLQLCQEAKDYHGWNWVTRVCLVVRLLRHARRVAPDFLEDIGLVVQHLFYSVYAVHPRSCKQEELRRLSQIFNRFLSLISLAPLKTPYNAYLSQQNVQLLLIRLMFAFQPQLPLTREGYRALIAVQLLHRKTAQERDWAHAKALSWPPWRQIKLGIEQDIVYPGKESRVIKLLRRMQQTGYTLGDWEKSAAILAGWDTDNSPTIQTRRILSRRRRPWLLAPPLRPWHSTSGSQDGGGHQGIDGPEVWAARIRATRTIRESWVSFCSYEKSKGTSPDAYQPYFAMLDRLLSPAVQSGSTLAWRYLPGDIKEPFEVSENSREVLYLDSEVPSTGEFYQHMLRAGIKPGGNILATLLRQSANLEAGFAYIQDSRWDVITKDVLRYAGKYPASTIRDSLAKIPVPTLAAFILLLAKGRLSENLKFRAVGYLHAATGELLNQDTYEVPALTYATQLLLAAGVNDIRVWNAFLEGVSVYIHQYLRHKGTSISQAVWRRLRLVLWPERKNISIHPDMNTFRLQAWIVHLMLRSVNTQVTPGNAGLLAKTTFAQVVYGRTMKAFLPPPEEPLVVKPEVKDLMLMVRVLVSTQDVLGLVALLKWINAHAKALVQVQVRPQSEVQETAVSIAEVDKGPVRSTLRDVMCAVRLFLEGSSNLIANGPATDEAGMAFLSPLHSDPAMVQAARRHCQTAAWPSDGEVWSFLKSNVAWVDQIRRAADIMLRRQIWQQEGRRKSG